METEGLITIREAADMMDVEVPTVYQMIAENRLPCIEVLGKKAVSIADVEAYLRRVRPDGVKPKGRPRAQADRSADRSKDFNAKPSAK